MFNIRKFILKSIHEVSYEKLKEIIEFYYKWKIEIEERGGESRTILSNVIVMALSR